MTIRSGLFLLLILSLGVPVAAGENRVTVYSTLGSFNRGYRDRTYVDTVRTSFPVMMTSSGGEYLYITEKGERAGLGVSGASIMDGDRWNYDRYETQTETHMVMPYVYGGHQFHYWALDLGIGCRLTYTEISARQRYNPDGSVSDAEDGGMGFKRRKSFVYVNFLVRLLPQDGIHVKAGMGREDFHPVDSFLFTSVVFPWQRHTGELVLSYPAFYWLPTSNQTLSFKYSYRLGNYILGARLGCLIYNDMGGKGPVSFFNRLSLGILAGCYF